MSSSRLISLALLLLVTMACGTPNGSHDTASTGTAGPAQTDVLTLRLGAATSPVPGLPESVLWLAQSHGFYAREGLNVSITTMQGTPAVVAALINGDVDVGDINNEDVIRLTAGKDLDLRTINSASGRNFFMIVGRDDLASVRDVAGKSFAIASLGSQDAALSQKVIAAEGIDPHSVAYLPMGQPQMRAQALAAGRVDATTLSLASWVSVQNEPHLKVLLSADDYFEALPLVNKGNAVTTRLIAEKPEALRRFTAALIRASRYYAQNKQAWVQDLSELRPDMNRDDLAYLWDNFGAAWAVNGQLNITEYDKTTDFLYESGAFDGKPRILASDWTDTHFVDSVLHDIGVYSDVDTPGRSIP